ISQGAVWAEHWAYIPPQAFAPPSIEPGRQVSNWIDSFILALLEQEGLEPSPPADRPTLIRRLYFDLIGLPPSAEEVTAYVEDESQHAWERVVDRLLGSPHYGERMAIYWLDLVRYADTVGYHGDQDVSISPYRDYVIAALNSNMPFDRFTREQLAGDLLPNATQDQLIASGYNRLGMMSAEGGVQDKEYLAKYAADRVRTGSTVWLGSTLGCAECHDHKFDPFTTEDFYRFAAFFADIKEKGLYTTAFIDGQWGTQLEIVDPHLSNRLEPLDSQLKEKRQQLEVSTPQLESAQHTWEVQMLSLQTPWHVLEPSAASALHGTQLEILADQSVLASGPIGEQNIYTLQAAQALPEITGFRLELLPHASLPKNGPGRANGNFVLTEFSVQTEQAGRVVPVPLKNASADFEQTIAADTNPYKVWGAASAIDGDVKGKDWGWAAAPQEGRSHQFVVEAAEPLRQSDVAGLTFRLEQNMGILPNFNIGRFRIWITAAPPPLEVDPILKLPDEVREALTTEPAERSVEQQDRLASYYRSIAPHLDPLRFEIATLEKQRAQVVAQHTRSTLVTTSVPPREIRILPRGNWLDDSGPVVQPGVPGFLPPLNVTERASRLDLANWLVSRSNPLTARVMVNRLWKLLFGVGLSKSLDDFGVQGEPPVYPELLDTLAVEFMDSGWDIKHMLRLMVLSASYRQSSLMREDLQRADPYNRLVARQARYRLDAELVRDNALAVSGLLIAKMGGRSVKPYQPEGLYQHLNFPPRTYQADSDDRQYRRGVYTHWQRQYLHPAMKSFDAPAREECTVERPRSITPLAALVLLNDPSYVEAARVFADRALGQSTLATSQRLAWMVEHALGRPASAAELTLLGELLESQRQHFANHAAEAEQLVTIGLAPLFPDRDRIELAAWTAVARTLFNLHEFITRN
ncbi:MAG: DUF1553 domain-containing protein, partial [Planctomycetales bacterium]|nr:DUF1553 domain-containing protein [Planctomycetales bacterium]